MGGICWAVTVFWKVVKVRTECGVEHIRTYAEQLFNEWSVAENPYRPYPHKASVRTPYIVKADNSFKTAEVGFGVNTAEINHNSYHGNSTKSEYNGKSNRHGFWNCDVWFFVINKIQNPCNNGTSCKQYPADAWENENFLKLIKALAFVVKAEREQSEQLCKQQHNSCRKEKSFQSDKTVWEPNKVNNHKYSHAENAWIAVGSHKSRKAKSCCNKINCPEQGFLRDNRHCNHNRHSDADVAWKQIFVADCWSEVGNSLLVGEKSKHPERINIEWVKHRKCINYHWTERKRNEYVFKIFKAPCNHKICCGVKCHEHKTVVSSLSTHKCIQRVCRQQRWNDIYPEEYNKCPVHKRKLFIQMLWFRLFKLWVFRRFINACGHNNKKFRNNENTCQYNEKVILIVPDVKICVREKQRKKREHNKQIIVCERLLYRIFFFGFGRRIFMLCRSHNKITFQYNVFQFYNAHTMLSRNKVSWKLWFSTCFDWHMLAKEQ